MAGYYEPGKTDKSNQQAQVDMIDASLEWAGVTEVKRMVDVGCGLGGSSRYIARKFGCSANGVTLSPFQVRGVGVGGWLGAMDGCGPTADAVPGCFATPQAQRANEITQAEGIDASFQVGDALDMPYEDNSFDLCWSMESGEHMPDKR